MNHQKIEKHHPISPKNTKNFNAGRQQFTFHPLNEYVENPIPFKS